MDMQLFISLEVFCQHHSVSDSFILSTQDFGLIEITLIDQTSYTPIGQLETAERLVRLHNDLEINTEGIEVVIQLLQRIEKMLEEIRVLTNKLSFYENDK